MHIDTLSETEKAPWVSISHAVLWMRARSISACVCSSARGNWIAWFCDSGLPKGLRTLAYSTDSWMQNWAAPRLEAAWRMRFSLKKCCTTCSPRPSPPKIVSWGTRTSVSETRPWSVGMLKVQSISSILKPSASVGVMKAVMPSPSPALPAVRAMMRSYFALWIPVFQVLAPLMTHSSPSRSAWVSMWVASEPCSGSVMPKANPRRPSARSSIHSAFC